MSLILKLQSLSTRIGEEIKVLRSQKQDKLVSGTSLRTVNGESLLGKGNLAVQGGGGLGAPVQVVPSSGIHAIDASLGRYFKLNLAEYTQSHQQQATITNVGYINWNLGNSTSSYLTVNVSGQQNGDLVLLFIGSDGSLPNVPAGFTQITRTTYGTEHVMACYGIIGDFNLTFQQTGQSISSIALLSVWRGVDTDNIFDVPVAIGSGSSGMPNPPAITTVTENTMILAVGFLDDVSTNLWSAPSGYFATNQASSSTTGQTGMVARKPKPTPGYEDPAAFTPANWSDEWISITIALRAKWNTVILEMETYVAIGNTPESEVYEAILDVECTSNKVNFPPNWTWNYLPDFKLNSGMQIRIVSDDGGTTFKVVAPIILEEYTKNLTIQASDIDWKAGAIFYKTITQATTLTFTNLEQGKVITAIINGNYTLALPGICKILSGEYNGGVTNYIQFMCVSQSLVLAVISQEVL